MILSNLSKLRVFKVTFLKTKFAKCRILKNISKLNTHFLVNHNRKVKNCKKFDFLKIFQKIDYLIDWQ